MAGKAEDTTVHILWINAGLWCDGDSVALTAATQPSIEEIVLGALPGLPKVARALAADRLRVRPGGRRPTTSSSGSARPSAASSSRSSSSSRARSPTKRIKKEGYWCGFGTDPPTGQPMTTCEWIDRLAPKALAVLAVGTCATYGGIHAMAGQSDRRHGACPTTSAGTGSRRPACRSSTCPAARSSRTTSPRRSLYLLYQVTGQAPMIPLDDATAADLAVRRDGPRGLRPRRLLRAGRLRDRVRLAQVHRQARLLGTGGQVQRPQARLDGRRRRLPERRRHLHRLHDAGLPRQVHAVHGRAARRHVVDRGDRRRTAASIRTLARHHQRHAEQGAEVAPPRPRADDRLSAASLSSARD